MSSAVVTRFAPSPTGSLHLGNARTAFFSHLWARKSGGRFILRIEDTDAERSEERFRDELIADLQWLGLDWDEGPDVGGRFAPYVQSERRAVYDGLFRQLESQGHAYACFCTPAELELSRKLQRLSGKAPRYAGTCKHLSAAQRAERLAAGSGATLRFSVPPARTVEFVDLVHGPQRFASDDIGDFLIRREDGSAAFFFCNAVDDSTMAVTHVLRGDDHLTNTPRQLMLLDALGLRRPSYGHVGLMVGADGTPLSKRHGSSSVQDFRDQGFLPAALLNYLFHLGHTGDAEGWLSPGDMPAHFRPERLGRAPARFEVAQLLHWQKTALEGLSAAALGDWLAIPRSTDFDAASFVELMRHNVVLPADATAWLAVMRGELPPLEPDERRIVSAAGPEFFAIAVRAFDEHGADLAALARSLKERSGRKGADLYLPLRVALTGRTHGPELAPLLRAMPREIARRRLEEHAHHS